MLSEYEYARSERQARMNARGNLEPWRYPMDDTKETEPYTENAAVTLEDILARGRLEFFQAQLQSVENNLL